MTPPMDHEAKAREIVEQHSYCVDTSFGNANELIKSIATALREERARVIEECANVLESYGDFWSDARRGFASDAIRALKDDTKE